MFVGIAVRGQRHFENVKDYFLKVKIKCYLFLMMAAVRFAVVHDTAQP